MCQRPWTFATATALLGTLFVGFAAQATVTCSGTVAALYTRSDQGTVMADYGYGMHQLCKIGETAWGVTAERCAVLYSTLLTAQSTGQVVDMYDRDEIGACANLGNWTVTGDELYGIHMSK